MNKLVIVFGTRPELIKLFPVIREFTLRGMRDKLIVVDSGQHADLTKDDLENFKIVPDHQLRIMHKGQSLQLLTARLLQELETLLLHIKSEGTTVQAILVQGDTNTAFAAALSAFYHRIPLLHVEAGLRTGDLQNPYPEEFNRKVTDLVAAVHFAPTLSAKQHLINEGVNESSILVTGNTIVDALLNTAATPLKIQLPETYLKNKNIILVTCHRRENERERILFLKDNLLRLSAMHPDYLFLWLNHPGVAEQQFTQRIPENFKMIAALSYSEMVGIYASTKAIITDSGGIQEEAASLNIPTLILRKKTEREELLLSGIGYTSSFSFDSMRDTFELLIARKKEMLPSPFGDGKAAERITDHICNSYTLL